MKADNERLAKKFEMENQNLQREILEKIELEQTIFTNVVSQVQKETEQEVADMKRDFREFGSIFEAKLEQNVEDLTAVTDEKVPSKNTAVEAELKERSEKLADEVDGKIQKVQAEVEKGTEEILKWQGEKAAQLNVKINNLQNKVIEDTLIQDKSKIV
jgi:hypothetical protein